MLSGAKVQSKRMMAFGAREVDKGRSQKPIWGAELGLGGEREGPPINISVSVSGDQPGSELNWAQREGRRLSTFSLTAQPSPGGSNLWACRDLSLG